MVMLNARPDDDDEDDAGGGEWEMEDDDAMDAVDLCDEILELCEDVPDRSGDFATSVTEKVESIREWICEHDHVTEKQMASLENMKSHIQRSIDRGW